MISRSRQSSRSTTYKWIIVFLEHLGNLPLLRVNDNDLRCSGHGSIASVFVEESIPGLLPLFDTPDVGITEIPPKSDLNEYVIDNLEHGEPYHVRVSSWNGVGSVYGSSKYSSPAITVTSEAPFAPVNILVSSWDMSTLLVSWKSLEVKGAPITKYYLEWDTEASFENINGSKIIDYSCEVQRIYLSALNADYGGFFHIYFMGQISEPIHWDFNSENIKKALENLSTIMEVEVSTNEVLQRSVAPVSRAGREWLITFIRQKGNVPSLLVSTGYSSPSTIATGGSLSGSSASIEVFEIVEGSLPSSSLISKNIDVGSTYFVRLKAHNVNGWSDFAVSSIGVGPTKQVPSKPRNVVMNAISEKEIGISWDQPESNGGDSITKYAVQWDLSQAFNFGSSLVYAVNSTESSTYSFVIPHLIPNQRYFVRVLAYNSQGYGEAQVAMNFHKYFSTYVITLFSGGENFNTNEKFALKYLSNYGTEQTTNIMGVNCMTAELENNLNALDLKGGVSVMRDDKIIGGEQFLVQYKIHFLDSRDDGEVSLDDTELFTIFSNVKLVSSGNDFYTISPTNNVPTGPEDVVLTALSSTELGLSWLPPSFDGGSNVDSYLVEWSLSRSFGSGNNSTVTIQSFPTNSISATSTKYKYQILHLNRETTYFVRVSAHNSLGYSVAVQPSPVSLVTLDKTLYMPTGIKALHSSKSIANRVDIEWSLPTTNADGFATIPDDCGIEAGHTPSEAIAYYLQWDTDLSMENSNSYIADMIVGDDEFVRCCNNTKCLVEVGAEVQEISINSNDKKPITDGSVKVIYVGKQSHSMHITMFSGSKSAFISSYIGSSEISTGDYILVKDVLYKVDDYNFPEVTLSKPYNGSEKNESQLVYFNTPPSSCFDVAMNNSAIDMKSHIEENFDNSPFGEDIEVNKRSISSSYGIGSTYRITFTGSAFLDETTELFIEYCSNIFEVDNSPSLKPSVQIITLMDSSTLVPGTNYYFQVAAINHVGIGSFGPLIPLSETPKSLPGLAMDCKVYAIPTSSDSLRVEWERVISSNGSNITKYEIEFYLSGNLTATYVFNENNIEQDDIFSIVQTGLEPGSMYQVNVVAVNEMGRGKF